MSTEIIETTYDCRICLEPDTRPNLIAPCKCAGSQKFVHRGCLNQWRATREDRAFSKCTECLAPYKMIARYSDSDTSILCRQLKFSFFITRDMLFIMAFLQTIVILLAALVYFLDKKSHFLITECRFESHPKLFYYIVGFTLYLATVGIVFISNLICCKQRFSNNRNCIDACCWQWYL